ncbi:unnamed protein product [Candida verbasci]|uniref:Uncharacterized protein n=1 Tax=Candida verbasci TaxID=1227364 RepID=A0A9W4TVS3_9ASCO|nr:unnamed protein product [Candida verbasci]
MSLRSIKSSDRLYDMNLDENNNNSIDIRPPRRSLLSEKLHEQQQKQQLQQQYYNLNEIIPGDHPEPELLASSVGKEINGRIIPSTSTISLLSLTPEANNKSPNLSSQPFIIRKNSISHSNIQRLQPYYRLTSPPPQSISQSNLEPESPNVDPTSLNNSPSRVWLNQTPNTSKNHHQFIRKSNNNNNNLNGSDSPILHPVQTPQEDPPMTPLYLSNQRDYFTRYDIREEDEEKYEEEEEEEEEEVVDEMMMK